MHFVFLTVFRASVFSPLIGQSKEHQGHKKKKQRRTVGISRAHWHEVLVVQFRARQDSSSHPKSPRECVQPLGTTLILLKPLSSLTSGAIAIIRGREGALRALPKYCAADTVGARCSLPPDGLKVQLQMYFRAVAGIMVTALKGAMTNHTK